MIPTSRVCYLLLICLSTTATCIEQENNLLQPEDQPSRRGILHGTTNSLAAAESDVKTIFDGVDAFRKTATDQGARVEPIQLMMKTAADQREVKQKRRETGSSESGSGDNTLLSGPISTPSNEDILSTSSLFFDSLVSNIVAADSVSSDCSRGWGELHNTTDSSAINNRVNALDAFGKLGAGYLQGNVYALGSYDECLSIATTQYCLTDLTLETPLSQTDLQFHYALCLPQLCSEDDIRTSLNSTSLLLNTSFQLGSIRCESENKAPYNAGAVLILFVWSVFAVMVLGATTVHVILRRMEEKKKDDIQIVEENTDHSHRTQRRRKSPGKTAMQFLLAFSLYESVPKIFATKKQPSSAITSLHGIRVLSMCWVILAHTHLWGFFFSSNISSFVRNEVSRLSYRAVSSGIFAVDSFFLMSGLLVTYLTLRHMDRRNGKFPLLPYYIHRLLRITPVYAFVLFSYWLLTVHLADGPIWQQTIGSGSDFYKSCERYWWTNLLYINNIYPQKHIDICMPWTWYLADDMQFFVIAPIMIVPLYLFYPAGLTTIGVLLAANVATLGGISGGYGLSVNIAKFDELNEARNGEGPEPHNITDDIYTKPWTRIGPYLIGILLGFIFYKQQKFKKWKPNFRKSFNYAFYATLWILAAVLCLSTVYGLQGSFNGDPLNKSEDISYQMFSRLAWSLGLAFITFACHNGYGGIVNDFLSMKFWIPLSRLTFVTYLVHAIVLFFLFFTRRNPVYGTDINTTLFTLGAVALSFSTAVIISSFVEFPLSNVETLIFKLAGLDSRESTRRSEIREEDFEIKENLHFEDVEMTNEVIEGGGDVDGVMEGGGDVDGVVEGGGDAEGVVEGGDDVEGVMEGGGDGEDVTDRRNEGEGVTGRRSDVESVMKGGSDVEGVTEGGSDVESVIEGGSDVEDVREGGSEGEGVKEGGGGVEVVISDVEGVMEGGSEGEGVKEGGGGAEVVISDVGGVMEGGSEAEGVKEGGGGVVKEEGESE